MIPQWTWGPSKKGPNPSSPTLASPWTVISNSINIGTVVKLGFYHHLVHAFISSSLDYCNALYTGISHSALSHLQLVQNSAARLLTGTKKREHISPILASLHWLPVNFRIEFNILLFVFKALNGLAPKYISDLIQIYTPRHRNNLCERDLARGRGCQNEVIRLHEATQTLQMCQA